jgi:Ca-activated chloride channel family protein
MPKQTARCRPPGPPRPVLLLLLVALAVTLVSPASPLAAEANRVEDLPERYQRWLEEVALLISGEEKREFLELQEDYQRDGFIAGFWKARDANPETDRNGFKEAWYTRLDDTEREIGNWTEDRARVFLLNGPPATREKFSCGAIVHPIEVWHYAQTERMGRDVWLLFLWRHGFGPARFWTPRDTYLELFIEPKSVLESRCDEEGPDRPGILGRLPTESKPPRFERGHNRVDISFECAMTLLSKLCGGSRAALAQRAIIELELEEEWGGNVETLLARLESRPDAEHEEWLETFASHTTHLPEGAGTYEGEVAVRYAGRNHSRTGVDVEVRVPRREVTASELGDHSSYDFVLTGEVLLDGELFEAFRYSFGLPAADAPDLLPLVVRRYLRPGDYGLVLKLEDVHGRSFLRRTVDLEVPTDPPPVTEGEEGWADEVAGAFFGGGEGRARAALELRMDALGVVVGGVRFDALPRGAEGDAEIDEVAFFLDGDPVLTRRRPPYTVELDLGDVPRPHTVRAVAYGAGGAEVAVAELGVNAGENRFGVRIVQPRSGAAVSGRTPVRVELDLPESGADGASFERLELYVSSDGASPGGERKVATLYQGPYQQAVEIPEGAAILRAVAHLDDGTASEDSVLLNVEGTVEEVDVGLVELYATVLDRAGRPVTDVRAEELRVREDGEPQEIVRFEPVTDRPVHVGVVVDASASMEEHLPRVRRAATGFLDSFLGPDDRAALISFNDRPRLLEKLTSDADAVKEELAGFAAEGNTALWDSVVFALHHLGGVQGQKALLVLTDGRDETSRFTFEQTLAYARAMQTTIYTIGIGTDMATRRHLSTLSEESGGRSFRVESSDDLEEIYATIARELRAGYLVVYQSPRSDGDRAFRRVDTEVTRPGHEVRTIRGYFP